MKEIKYLNHIVRNGFLYIILFVSLNIIFGFTQPIQFFILGFLTLTIGYSPVYFLNDYMDREEDVKHHKENLYNTIKNHFLFWILGCACLIFGIGVAFYLSFNAFVLLLVLYGLNLLYSIKPFRFRNVFFLREVMIFCINVTKWFFVIFLMNFDPAKSPLPLLLFAASLISASNVVYKQYIDTRNTKPVLYTFLIPAFIGWLLSLWMYPQIFFIIFPVIPMIVFMHYKYKNKPTPNGKFLLGYIIYFVFVVVVTKFLL